MRLKRSHYCGVLRKDLVGKEVTLCGWVDRWRDHGGIVFIDLRDREGTAQIVFDPTEASKETIELAATLRQETVVAVKGTVKVRPEGMTNKNLPTGEVEIWVKDLELLNRAAQLPFSLHEDSPSAGEVDETLRATYRYLELRRTTLQNNLKLRHKFLKASRDFYDENGFWEIETPILYKSTPEGARDYLVPSRVHPGKFYALPQSPQTLKQLCMIGGVDRYVQVARCFRDEDLRADRQPEFTQIDVEMSFTDELEIQTIHEGLMKKVWKQVLNTDIPTPFTRITYAEAMRVYGNDKPDLRNRLKLVDLTAQGKKSSFQVYKNALEGGTAILKGLCFEEKEALSRSELDNLVKKVRPFGAQGITWIRIKSPGDWQSPQAKFFDEALKKEIEEMLPFKSNCMLFMICAAPKITNNALSSLRDEFGDRYGYVDKKKWAFAWVVDFPLFIEDEGRLYAAHHPFTGPHLDDLATFKSLAGKAATGTLTPGEATGIRARAYDMVLNGVEIGGGSCRIYDSETQGAMFAYLGMSEEDAKNKFGFFMEALKYGTPPHGGIAFGVDRIAMLIAGTDAIRDVIAFPKTQKASCLMSDCPSDVDPKQLLELSIKLDVKEPEAKA